MHQAGLEVGDPPHVPEKYDPTNFQSTYDAPMQAPATGQNARICGLPKRTFWIAFIIAILVIGAAIGGGIGGALVSKNNKSNVSAPIVTSATGSATSSFTTATASLSTTSSTLSQATATSTSGFLVDDKVHSLLNAKTETYMDLNGGSAENGTSIQGWKSTKDISARAWKILPVDRENPRGTYYYIINAVTDSIVTVPQGLDFYNDNSSYAYVQRAYGSNPGDRNDKHSQFKLDVGVIGGEQRWVSFTSVAYPRKALEILNGDNTEGTGVIAWTWTKAPSIEPKLQWIITEPK